MFAKYVEGYASQSIKCCPFCESKETWYINQTGEHECKTCKAVFHVIQNDSRESEGKVESTRA